MPRKQLYRLAFAVTIVLVTVGLSRCGSKASTVVFPASANTLKF